LSKCALAIFVVSGDHLMLLILFFVFQELILYVVSALYIKIVPCSPPATTKSLD
jgi:hypothetical protein